MPTQHSRSPAPNTGRRVADGRGRGITVIYGLQAWASARARFGEDTAKELAAFTNNVIVLPGDKDPDFLKDMSDLCGQVERERTTKTTSGGDRGGHSTATHMALEPVLRGDEIRGLPAGHALVLADNFPPIVTRLDGMWTWDAWSEIEGHVRDLEPPTKPSGPGGPPRGRTRPRPTRRRGPDVKERLPHDRDPDPV